MRLTAICAILLFGTLWNWPAAVQTPRNERFAVIVTERTADLTTLEGCEHGKKITLYIPEKDWQESEELQSWRGHHEKGYLFALHRDEEDGRLKFAGRITPDCASGDGCCFEQHARDSQYEFQPSTGLNTDGTCAD